ncbi:MULTISPECIES: ABC transporter substrate-binding protein [Clostridium]|uniref:ABC transporter substrate-binding protein n=1 Tax=Clostridium TaxID=1485 RepID=UPI00156FA98D|nr:ABC transporter substrate-binding protein [Clostridium beijerinckii]NRT71441.1 sulfonate transport system substrate-binding protein [Clostridium beijerinckii]
MKRKLFMVVSVAMTVMMAMTGCSLQNNTAKTNNSSNESTKKVVNIAYGGTSGHMPHLAEIAKQNKYFEEELSKIGYEPNYLSFSGAGPEVNEAIVSNKVDVAFYGDLPAIILKSKGVGISLVGINNSNTNMNLIVPKDSKITSVKDIKGKKIIVLKGTVTQNYFQHLIDANNIKINELEVVNAAKDANSAFLSGSVDGYVATDIVAEKLVQDNSAKVIDSTINNPQWSSQATVISRDEFAENNPEAQVAVLKALIRAKAYAKENNEEAYKMLDSGFGESSTKRIYDIDGGKFDFFSVDVTDYSINKLKDLNNFLLDQKLISTSVDINRFINKSYYEKAVQELES